MEKSWTWKKASSVGDSWTTSLEIARVQGVPRIISLLERFTANRAQTQYELRLELGLPVALASEMFALVIFLGDDTLKIRETEAQTPTGRFFTIVKRLPMELQMILCHRAFGCNKQNILSRDSELSFKQLAKVFSSCPTRRSTWISCCYLFFIRLFRDLLGY